jgi:hypothetical protein
MSQIWPFLLGSTLVAAAQAADLTSVRVNGTSYGAEPDHLGPIGGGPGYSRILTTGDFLPKDLDQLLDALAGARAGQVIFIPGDIEIDCTARIYIEDLVLKIPTGVTLAGNRGHNGSPGALICSDALKTPAFIRAAGPDVRITGLRIRGPNPKRYLDHHRRSFAEGRGHEYYYRFPTSDGIKTEFPGLEIDNCEISAFSAAGVGLEKGDRHHIHHSFIHHCQYAGLGYGICHNQASSLIERNLFDFNRHSIAGSGVPGCSYEARHNVEMGTSLKHCFDMHGGADRKDGTHIAGTRILIHHNTFRAETTPVAIRGVPEEACKVYANWFLRHSKPRDAVFASEKTELQENAYGSDPPQVIR